METNSTSSLFRFGVFEADEKTEELRKQGRRLPLQGQPLQVLLMLLRRPGELVTRTEIHQKLWPEGTFVDFDHSLNTAINKVRESLGDSASSPRFIETLARRGYRFVAPVEVISNVVSFRQIPVAQAAVTRPEPFRDQSVAEPVPILIQEQASGPVTQSATVLTPDLLTTSNELPQASRSLVRWLFFLLQVMYLCFYLVLLGRVSVVESIMGTMIQHTFWEVVVLIVTAAVGIPIRLYLISAVSFDAPGLRENFLKIFLAIFPLDELWALAPFLLVHQIGYGLALGLTAILLYAPFAQRSLILMGAGLPYRLK
jgi:cholera toxin transcriptional activator